jgi:hypothetical protein
MRLLQVLTNSEGECYDECPAKHGYAYHELLRPIATSKPLQRGTLYHAGVAAGWRAAWGPEVWHRPLAERVELARTLAGAVIEELSAEAAAELSKAEATPERFDALDEVTRIATWGARRYFQERQSDLDPARFLPLAVEQPFSVRLPNAAGHPTIVQYEGVVDLVIYDREMDIIRIEDHKMPEDGPSALEKKIDLNTQTTGYLAAVRELQKDSNHGFWRFFHENVAGSHEVQGISIARVLQGQTGLVAFNVMRGKIPAEPRINQKGDVSVAECSTLPEIYERALLDQAADRGIVISQKQRERLEQIRAKARWFEQMEFFRSDEEIQRWLSEVLVKARLIRESGRNPELRIRRPVHCSSASSYVCAYKAVCIDPTSDAVRRTSYRVATDSHEEVAEAKEQQNGSEKDFGW